MWQSSVAAKLIAGALIGVVALCAPAGLGVRTRACARFAAPLLLAWGALGLIAARTVQTGLDAGLCLRESGSVGPAARPTDGAPAPNSLGLRRDAVLRVRVLGLPQTRTGARPLTRFAARVLDARCRGLRGATIGLSWSDAPPLVAGQTLTAVVRLRPLRGKVNFAGADFEVLQRAQGVALSGYVRRPYGLTAPRGAVADRVRAALRARLDRAAPEYLGVIEALLIGAADRLRPGDWDALRRTGTVHLVVVSGLHVGLVALLLNLLVAGVERCLGALGRAPPPLVGLVALGCGLGLFVLLTGAGTSTRRAFWMTLAGVIAWRAGRRLPPAGVVASAWLLVVVAEPLAAFTSGFWLSFALVIWLLFCVAKRAPSGEGGGRLRELCALHAGCSLLMAPVLLWLGLVPAPLAALANLLAVPWVSLVVVPTTLLVLPTLLLGDAALRGLLALLDALIGGLFWWLDRVAVAGANLLVPDGQGDGPRMLALCALVVIALLPVARAARSWAALILLLWLFAARQPIAAPPAGAVEIETLDVGQGTAVVVRTARHLLVYDTGPAFPGGGDLAAAVLGPALERRPDLIIVSHGDIDHAGGLGSLLGRYRRLPPVIADAACVPQRRWRWDGVRFRLWRWPLGAGDNDRSCVLSITAGAASALLPGDIERDAEARLVASGDLLPPGGVDFVLVPHHGSRTSSTPAFVDAAAPRVAVISRGAGNRFGHPHEAVVRAYGSSGARLVDTAHEGAVRWRSDWPGAVETARAARDRRWFFGAPLIIRSSMAEPLTEPMTE